MSIHAINILGAGSFGTAIAIHLALAGYPVHLWARSKQQIQDMQKNQSNHRYLPNSKFPENLKTTHLLEALDFSANLVIIAVPSHAFVPLLHQLPKPHLGVAWLTKGLDPESNRLLNQEVAKHWGADFPMCVISGPSFAKEIAQCLPTALVLAGNHSSFTEKLSSALHQSNIRVYLSDDMIGVQIAGAVKNVLAIACGISDGLNFGANARAALITRGLAEMNRLGQKLGALPETFLGLAGVGDLVLTCTDNQSRNRRFGLLLGAGKSIAMAEQEIGQVIEGKSNARQISHLAQELQVDMPICQTVLALLNQELNSNEAFLKLMKRPIREE